MQKYVQFLSVLLFVACIAACGSSEVTTIPETQIYEDDITVTTLTGVAKTAGSSDDSPATFNHPTDITTTDGSTFFIADYANNAIRKVITTPTSVVSTLICTTVTDGITTPAIFNGPFSLTKNGTYIYVVDNSSHTIRFIDTDTNIVTTVGSTLGLAGSVDSTIPTDVLFYSPTGIATDGTYLYVADSGNHTIRKIEISSKAVSTLAGAAGLVGSTDSTDGTAARFNGPQRIAIVGEYLYVTDFYNRTIRKIDRSTGATTTLAGMPGPVGTSGGIADSTDVPGTGATARFNQPSGITTDGTTYLYVTDSYMNTIRKIVISTGETTTVSGIAGIAGFVDTVDGTPSFDTPIGITTTDGVNLYVTDTNNNTIRKIAQ